MRGDLFSSDIATVFDKLDYRIEYGIQTGEVTDGQAILVVAGSAPLIYNKWIPYGTDDIDYVSCTSQWLSQHLPEYRINNRIQAHGDSWAYNYEDRLELMYEGKYLLVYQLCLEDLIFMKLTRWSDNDIEDLESIVGNNVAIDLDFLAYLVYDEEESRGAGMSDKTYQELLISYSDFLERLENSNWRT